MPILEVGGFVICENMIAKQLCSVFNLRGVQLAGRPEFRVQMTRIARPIFGDPWMARSSTKRFRLFRLTHASVFCAGALTLAGVALGCRGYQYGHIVKNGQPDLVGSHAAGAEVFNPLIDETVAKLLGRVEASGQYGLVSPRWHADQAGDLLCRS